MTTSGVAEEQHTLITGGAGFIGSHLTARLLNEGEKVVVIDDLSTGSYQNLPSTSNSSKLKFIERVYIAFDEFKFGTVTCTRQVFI